jgi:hypothetical protein
MAIPLPRILAGSRRISLSARYPRKRAATEPRPQNHEIPQTRLPMALPLVRRPSGARTGIPSAGTAGLTANGVPQVGQN